MLMNIDLLMTIIIINIIIIIIIIMTIVHNSIDEPNDKRKRN